jgi:hypothetical protein
MHQNYIAIDTSPKYIWTFSIFLIFIHKYNVLLQAHLKKTVMWINIKTMGKVHMYFSDVSRLHCQEISRYIIIVYFNNYYYYFNNM